MSRKDPAEKAERDIRRNRESGRVEPVDVRKPRGIGMKMQR